MAAISSRTQTIPLSGIREMMDLASTIPNVLHLEIGDPNFQTPQTITAAAATYAANNRVGYPPNSGLPQLRKAIAKKVTERNGIACTEENVNVTIGATGALYLALLAVLEEGDEVLVPDPGWAGYPAMVGLAGGVMKPYALRFQNNFKLTAEDVAAAISPKTKAIIINSPSNPTGAVSERSELKNLLDLANERDLWIIADECYDEVVFKGQHDAIGAMTSVSDARVLSAFSFSKTYAMTGWRIGYLVAPVGVSRQVTRMQAASVASASVVSQIGALEALSGSQAPVQDMVTAYARRGGLAARLLDAANIRYVPPEGALYIFVDIRPTGLSAKEAAIALLRDHAVCTTPGSAFGDQGEGFLRISLASADEELEEGLKRLVNFVKGRA